MVPLLYTDSDKALAAAGLSSDDLSDAFMVARDFTRLLSVDLYGWLPTHAALYIPVDVPYVSEAARYRSDLLTLYCTHFCASRVLQAVLSLMVKESDGQNEYDRFSNLDLKAAADDMLSKAGFYQQALLSELQSTSVAPVVSLFSLSAPSYDPVTG